MGHPVYSSTSIIAEVHDDPAVAPLRGAVVAREDDPVHVGEVVTSAGTWQQTTVLLQKTLVTSE